MRDRTKRVWGGVLTALGVISLVTGWSGASVWTWYQDEVLHRRVPASSILSSGLFRTGLMAGGCAILLALLWLTFSGRGSKAGRPESSIPSSPPESLEDEVLRLVKNRARTLEELEALTGAGLDFVKRATENVLAAGTAVEVTNEQGQHAIQAVIGAAVEHETAMPIAPIKSQRHEAESEWLIHHRWGIHPRVTILDASGSEVLAGVRHPSIDSVSVEFGQPQSGRADRNERSHEIEIRLDPMTDGNAREPSSNTAREDLAQRARTLAEQIKGFVRTRRVDRPQLSSLGRFAAGTSNTVPEVLSKYDNETRIQFEERYFRQLLRMAEDLPPAMPEGLKEVQQLGKSLPQTVAEMLKVANDLEGIASVLESRE